MKQLYESGFSFSFFRNARFIRPTYLQSKLLFFALRLRLRSSFKSVLFDFFYILNGIKHIPPLKEKEKSYIKTHFKTPGYQITPIIFPLIMHATMHSLWLVVQRQLGSKSTFQFSILNINYENVLSKKGGETSFNFLLSRATSKISK